MSNTSWLVSVVAVAVPVFLVGCGRTTEPRDSQPAQRSPADKTPKFTVSFSTDAPSSSPGQAARATADSGPEEKAAGADSGDESPSVGKIVGVVTWNGAEIGRAHV